MIELGAGTALPSFVAAIQRQPPRLVVITDYPDPELIENIRINVAFNIPENRRSAINVQVPVLDFSYLQPTRY